ncbi:MAG: DUF1566 domain-containing protein [bacterium]
MKRLHLAWGWIFAITFALTGVWMQAHFPAAYHGDVGARMLYRSAHVYILLASFLNCLLGVYLARVANAARARIQNAGSVLVLIAPVMFTVAFFVEPAPGVLGRPYTAIGLWSAIFGTLAHLAAMRGQGEARARSAAAEVEEAPADAAPDVVGRSLRWWGRALVAGAIVLALVAFAWMRTRTSPPSTVALHEHGAEVVAKTTIAVTPVERRAVADAVQAGRRFADCGNGTVIDLATNRMWADADNGNGTDWPGAAYYARMFRAGGYTDWRLPTIAELLELAQGYLGPDGKPVPGAPSVDSWLPVGYGVPWSSEVRGAEAARVHLGSGAVGWLPQASTSHNRAVPVRDGRGALAAAPPSAAPSARVVHAERISESLFPAEPTAATP